MPKVSDLTLSLRGKPGSVIAAGDDGKLHTVERGLEFGAQSGAPSDESEPAVPAGTHMPKMESGMRMVYDGAGDLMKITSADGSIYYFPEDDSTPAQYKGGTWFIWVDYSQSSEGREEAHNIDTARGMQGALRWIETHPGVKNPAALRRSLQIQQGTQTMIYYMGKL